MASKTGGGDSKRKEFAPSESKLFSLIVAPISEAVSMRFFFS